MEENKENSPHVSEVSLRDYIDLLRRRKATVIETFAVVFVAGVIVTWVSKPVYRTSTRMLVDGKSSAVTSYNPSDPLSAFVGRESHDITTRFEILQDSELLQKAFVDAGVPPGSVQLDIKAVNSSDVIELTAQSNNRDYATRFAKALPATYAKFFTSSHSNEIDSAIEFARKRLKEETAKVRYAEEKLKVIRSETRVYTTSDELQRKLRDNNAADAEVQRLKALIAGEQARLSMLTTQTSLLADYVPTRVVVANTEADLLKAKIIGLEDDRAQLLLKYNISHPRLREQDELIADARRRLSKTNRVAPTNVQIRNLLKEANEKTISDLHASLAAERAFLNKAQEHAHRTTVDLVLYGDGSPKQKQLEADATRARERVTQLTADLENLLITKPGQHSPIKVVAPALNAAEVSPKSAKNLVYPAIIGLVLGFCFALLQEFLDDRINSPEDARLLMDAPALGYVPLVEAAGERLLSQSQHSGLNTSSFSLLESYRVVRSNVQFATVDNPKNSVLITSTKPGEGKSVTAANFAVAVALGGQQAILVDADLRRPTQHDKFCVKSRLGLTNVLLGQTSLEEALQDTNVPGLRLLAAGPLPPNPSELLNSQAMRQLHAEMKTLVDIVIYDSPAMLTTADAQVLSASVDGVLYVVQFGETKKTAIRHSIELLKQARANVLGVILNKIDLTTRRDDYYYGYSTYYQYYQPDKLTRNRRSNRSTEEFDALLSKFKGSGEGKSRSTLPTKPSGIRGQVDDPAKDQP